MREFCIPQLISPAWKQRGRSPNGYGSAKDGFTGHEMLDSICEINANARIYDPTIARFMSADILVQGSDAQACE